MSNRHLGYRLVGVRVVCHSMAHNGTHPSFSEEEVKKLIKSNERITRKEIAEYFDVLPRTIRRSENWVHFTVLKILAEFRLM